MSFTVAWKISLSCSTLVMMARVWMFWALNPRWKVISDDDCATPCKQAKQSTCTGICRSFRPSTSLCPRISVLVKLQFKRFLKKLRAYAPIENKVVRPSNRSSKPSSIFKWEHFEIKLSGIKSIRVMGSWSINFHLERRARQPNRMRAFIQRPSCVNIKQQSRDWNLICHWYVAFF